jgi:hypothetical protein
MCSLCCASRDAASAIAAAHLALSARLAASADSWALRTASAAFAFAMDAVEVAAVTCAPAEISAWFIILFSSFLSRIFL